MRIGFSAAGRGRCGFRIFVFGGRFGQRGAKRVVQPRQSFAVFGADRDRVAEAERIGFKNAGLGGTSFTLVGNDDCRLARSADQVGESAVGRGCAGAGIDEKEHRIGLRQGSGGLRLNPCRKAFTIAVGLFEPRGVDDLER